MLDSSVENYGLVSSHLVTQLEFTVHQHDTPMSSGFYLERFTLYVAMRYGLLHVERLMGSRSFLAANCKAGTIRTWLLLMGNN